MFLVRLARLIGTIMKIPLKTGPRVLLSFAAILLILVCVSCVALWRLHAANASTRDLVEDKLARQQLTASLLGAARLGGNTALSIAKSDSLETQDYFHAQLAGDEKRSDALLAQLNRMPRTAAEEALWKDMLASRQAYSDVRRRMFAFKEGGRTQEADALADGAFRATLATHIAAVDSLLAHQTKQAHVLAARSSRDYDRSVTTLVGFGLAALALGTALAWAITRSVIVPLRHAVDAARPVADGDLRPVGTGGRSDEIGELLDALHHMTLRLGQTLRSVRDSAATIDAASGELASGNADLSRRTEHQAAALEETASSMVELAAALQRNAGKSQMANELVSKASTIASRGREVVGAVVGTMDDISGAAVKIADITGVIDGIAFQTNILALNAAVEAARAGEQGRGFAVVASEVRTLAHRSAAAAHQIKQLINESVAKIASGSALTHRAGDTMADIVASVGQVTDIMAQIAAATSRQDAQIKEINGAVAGMDSVTQQNAALVEEAAATAERMHDEARKLMGSIRFFAIDAGERSDPSLLASV